MEEWPRGQLSQPWPELHTVHQPQGCRAWVSPSADMVCAITRQHATVSRWGCYPDGEQRGPAPLL